MTPIAETPRAQEPAPPPSSRGMRYARLALYALALVVSIVLGALGWLFMGYPEHVGPGRGRVVELQLQEGASVAEVAQQLAARGALAEPRLFTLHARLRGAATRLRTGTVLVYDSMRPRELLQRVARGYGSAELRVVIPEGFSRFDIAARFGRWGVCDPAAFVRASEDRALLGELGISANSAEGWLFPDTYRLRDDTDPKKLVRSLVANARRRMAPVFDAHAAGAQQLERELDYGQHEVLTLASIVEKEAKLPSEQPVIAGVFLNRLRTPEFAPKRLQADPTVAYGCAVLPSLPSCRGFNGRDITRAMLVDANNVYNTYRILGLPPGPIANPGLGAVRAVLSPAVHDYFYFVASAGGQHVFSRTLAEHQLAVDQLRQHKAL